VYVISGTNDFQLSATISNINQPFKIVSVPNTGKVICGGLNNIYVINAATNTILATISNPNEAMVSDFVFSDLYPDKAYASCFYSGKVIKINLVDNVIENTLNVSTGLTDFAYNNENYVLYVVKNGASSVYIINESTFTLSSTLNVKPYSSELLYNPLTKSIYLLSSGGKGVIGGITVIKGSTIAKVINISGVHSPGMILNPINNMLYFHTFFNPYSNEKESYLTVYDCTDDDIKSTVYLGQKQNYGEGTSWWNVDEGMVFNPENNQLIIGNRGFSNLSVIKCATDVLGLNFGWRWISFPRMERYAFNDDPVHPVPIMKNASFYPGFYFTLWSQNPTYKKIFNPNMPDPWSGLLYEVYSTLGYKYEAPPADLPQPRQTLTGARLHPECPIGLPASGGEKWIGYFIEEAQYPWQAFPADVYNNKLTMIQAQYWTMVKIPPGGWLVTNKVKPIRYGDMVIVKTNLTQSETFIWNNPNDSQEDVEIPQPQAYTWEEKADYTPFYIETESTGDIAEIAVMVDGVCRGATVRNPGDTLTEVAGYFEGLPVGSVLEFETWNGLKSSPVERNGYVVYNPTVKKKEKRNIYVGEKQDYYLVSFKAGEVFEIPDDISHVTCGPNPFRDETILTMRLNNEQHIAVEVYNIQGVKIKTLLNSDLPGGYYEVIWNGDNEKVTRVKEGVYFYKIKAGNGTIVTDKIILIK
jgi:DNA-binding beta-propeller fold protein YncE